MSCGVGHRDGSDPALLWLWQEAAAPIRPLAWEPPYTVGVALKSQKKKKNQANILINISPKTYRNGHQSHEKMLNIISHQKNANQNHNEITPHTY